MRQSYNNPAVDTSATIQIVFEIKSGGLRIPTLISSSRSSSLTLAIRSFRGKRATSGVEGVISCRNYMSIFWT